MTTTPLFAPLGDTEALLTRAASQDRSDINIRVNAHVHLPPNFSAFETAAQAVGLAGAQGVGVLGANNYYDLSVYRPFAADAIASGIFPLLGLEIITRVDDLADAGIKVNDPGNPGKMYICGKGIAHLDPLSDAAIPLLDAIRTRDSLRIALVIDRLNERFADAGLPSGPTEVAIKQRYAHRAGRPVDTVYLQERHVAEAFQEAIFDSVGVADRAALLERAYGAAPKSGSDDAAGVQGEIRSLLMKAGKPAFVPETFVDPAHAFRLILSLGGIPCYPILADGTSPICAFETPIADFVARLRQRGFHCVELIPIRNTPEVVLEYVRALRAAGMIVLAGTEHNTRDLLPIEPTCLHGAPIPPEAQAIFVEGASIVAAHQYLVANGRAGYLDAAGNLTPGFVTDEERIAHFRRIGATIIAACALT